MADGGVVECMEVDLEIPNPTSQAAAAAPSRGRFKPKLKSASAAAATKAPVRMPQSSRKPSSEATTSEAADVSAAAASGAVSATVVPDVLVPKEEPSMGPAEPIEGSDGGDDGTMIEEEDSVVREIDVFFNCDGRNDESLLYVMQYPLWQSYHRYELSKHCSEIRVKPKKAEVEIDLTFEDDEDADFDGEGMGKSRSNKMTYRSMSVPLVTNYAVGVVVDDQAHLNRIDAIVQMRPSRSHLDVDKSSRGDKKPKSEGTSGAKVNVEKAEGAGDESEENWVPLEYFEVQDPRTSKYYQMMMSDDKRVVGSTMSVPDYLNSLCGVKPSDSKKRRRPSIAELLKHPLEQRLVKWFTEVSQVSQYKTLQHLSQDCSEEDFLKSLQDHAYLVRGNWICKSSLMLEGINAIRRDAVLFCFTKQDKITEKELQEFKFPSETWQLMIDVIFRRRIGFRYLKFKEPMDASFIKRYPNIVREQERAWEERRIMIEETLRKSRADSVKSVSAKAEPNQRRESNAPPSQGRGLSDETRKHLLHALTIIFKEKKVLSLQSIVQNLRKLATVLTSLPKETNKSLVSAVSEYAMRPPQELLPFVAEVAAYVHGVYAMRSPEGESLRNVVINMFRESRPAASIKRQDILSAGQKILKREIADSEYKQVVEDLCDCRKDGLLTLKSGDQC